MIVQTPNIEYLIGFNETDKYLVDIKIDGEYLYGIMRNGTKIWLKGIDIKSGEIALDLTFLIDVDEIYSTLMLEIDMGHYYILGATFNSVVF